jgi:hypothetical protein
MFHFHDKDEEIADAIALQPTHAHMEMASCHATSLGKGVENLWFEGWI